MSKESSIRAGAEWSTVSAPRRAIATGALVLLAISGVVGFEMLADRVAEVAWLLPANRLSVDSAVVVRQEHDDDCGPAALKMVLDHFSIDSSLEELRRLAETKAAGTTLLGLKRAAESKGLRGEGWRLSLEHLADIELPVIAHVHDHHFVVVREIGERIAIDDPALGSLAVKEAVFRRVWDGVVLAFAEGGDSES